MREAGMKSIIIPSYILVRLHTSDGRRDDLGEVPSLARM